MQPRYRGFWTATYSRDDGKRVFWRRVSFGESIPRKLLNANQSLNFISVEHENGMISFEEVSPEAHPFLHTSSRIHTYITRGANGYLDPDGIFYQVGPYGDLGERAVDICEHMGYLTNVTKDRFEACHQELLHKRYLLLNGNLIRGGDPTAPQLFLISNTMDKLADKFASKHEFEQQEIITDLIRYTKFLPVNAQTTALLMRTKILIDSYYRSESTMGYEISGD